MNQENFDEYVANAEMAFNNKEFGIALDWYKKALEENQNDIYVISRIGALCVPLNQFDDAMKYFKKAVELDPENGDNLFNLGNAYFFAQDYTNALKYYSMADTVGCSDEAKSKLYYQMAVICSVNGNVESALTNYQKYEDCDASNGVNPDVISEKVKLYLLTNDIENALKCASQLVLVAPKKFNGYIIYFQVLLAVHNYKKAEEILNDALKYATLTSDNKITIEFERVALYISQAENDNNLSDTYYSKALELLYNLKSRYKLEQSRLNEVLLTSAEVYLKLQKYDDAIRCVQEILNEDNHNIEKLQGHESNNPSSELPNNQNNNSNSSGGLPTLESDNSNGGLPTLESNNSNDGLPILGENNSSGGLPTLESNKHKEIPRVDSSDLDANSKVVNQSTEEVENQPTEKEVINYISEEMRDKINFILLSCYSEKEEYSTALKYAEILKNNTNPYYMYYGMYVEAFASKQLELHNWRSLYDETIAFFKSRMVKNPSDRIALVFRIRLYAELGKFAKALELSKIISTEERKSILEYIKKYQDEYKSK